MKTFLLKSLALFTLTVLLFSCKEKQIINIDCLSPNLQNGLLAFYAFNSGSLIDESQNGNDLSNPTAASPTTDRSGNTNCAFQFDNRQALEQHLELADASFLNNLNSFSVALWYCPVDTSRAGGIYEALVSRGSELRCPNRAGEWSLGLYDCRKAVFGHDHSVWINGGNNSCKDQIINFTDQWQHVAAVKDQQSYRIYYNGVLEETVSGMAGCTNTILAQNIDTLFLGKFYTGKIDDVLIYDRALSAQEILELHDLEACCQ